MGNEEGLRMKEVNVNVMDKTMSIQGATIVLTIWDVGGFFLSNLNLFLCFQFHLSLSKVS